MNDYLKTAMHRFMWVFLSAGWVRWVVEMEYVAILRIYGVGWGCGRTLEASKMRTWCPVWSATESHPVTMVTGCAGFLLQPPCEVTSWARQACHMDECAASSDVCRDVGPCPKTLSSQPEDPTVDCGAVCYTAIRGVCKNAATRVRNYMSDVRNTWLYTYINEMNLHVQRFIHSQPED